MRVARPETRTLTLSTGETLIVKGRLNAGEREDMYRAMRDANGRLDSLLIGPATILAYLLDWTVIDHHTGTPLVIRGQSAEAIRAMLRTLEADDYKEIETAIDGHDDRMIAEAAEEKKLLGTRTESGSVSSSVPASDSRTTMSAA